MKKRYLTIIQSCLFIFLISLSFVFLPPARADGPNATTPTINWQVPKLQVKIPGLPDFTAPTNCTKDESTGTTNCEINWINQYVAGIYNYAIGIVGILAAVVLMFGGLLWLTAGGNTTQVGEAKAWIGASLTGLLIALSSYMIMYQINPATTSPKGLNIDTIKEFVIPPEMLTYDGDTGGDGTLSPPSATYNQNTYDDYLIKLGSKLNVDPALLKAIMATESNGNPLAKSPAGAMGLMQLMPKTAQWLGVANAYDPYQNLDGGSRYIASLLKRYNGDMSKALAAYNWGPGRVDKYGLDTTRMPNETKNYILKVKAYLIKFQGLGKK
jgi:hypothetical protein